MEPILKDWGDVGLAANGQKQKHKKLPRPHAEGRHEGGGWGGVIMDWLADERLGFSHFSTSALAPPPMANFPLTFEDFRWASCANGWLELDFAFAS